MPDLADIQRAVASSYGITYADMFGQGRARKVAEPRQVTMFLARELTALTTTQIGHHFARDHSTVLHAVWRIGAKAADSRDLSDRLDTLRGELQGKESLRGRFCRELAAAQTVACFLSLLDDVDLVVEPDFIGIAYSFPKLSKLRALRHVDASVRH